MIDEKNDMRVIFDLYKGLCKKGVLQNKEITGIESLRGDASERRYYRINLPSHSYIACIDDSLTSKKPLFLEVGSFLEKSGVRVPSVYGFNPISKCLFQEDLGDMTLLKYSIDLNIDGERDIYKKCVDLLVRIQLSEGLFPDIMFDQKKLDQEVDFSIKHFLGYLRLDHSSIREGEWGNMIDEIRKGFSSINSLIVEREKVFTHRDFHSKNIMIKNSEPVIIDFQGAMWGLPQYDLVSLLDDCYYNLNVSNKENIKKYYFSQINQIVKDQRSYSDFSYLYDLMSIQRTFKALGSFASFFRLRSDDRYLKYIGFSCEKLKTTMDKYQDLSSLRKILFGLYYDH